MEIHRRPLFRLGRLVATPGALNALAEAGELAFTYLSRHAQGDWGDMCADDRRANDAAVTNGSRVFSSYRTRAGTKLWIITEADRSSTCILLPGDY